MAKQATKAALKTKAKPRPAKNGIPADAKTFAYSTASGGWSAVGATGSETKFDATAQRVMTAVKELNAALVEARENTEMRVELWSKDTLPREFLYRIYRLTHSQMTMQVKVAFGDKHNSTEWWKNKYQPVEKPEHDADAA